MTMLRLKSTHPRLFEHYKLVLMGQKKKKDIVGWVGKAGCICRERWGREVRMSKHIVWKSQKTDESF